MAMPDTPLPLLEGIQLLPLLGGGLVLLARRRMLAIALSLLVGGLNLGLVLLLLHGFAPDATRFDHVTRLVLAGPVAYHVGVDGIGVLFLLVTAFLFLMVMIYGTFVRHFAPLHRFLGVVLLLESTVLGQFASLDLFWFALLSLGEILLAGHLLRSWATSSSEAPAVTRYYQFMGMALLLLFAAALLLGEQHAAVTHGTWRFDLPALAAIRLPLTLQTVVFFLLLYAFAIRIPMFPLHAWLPTVAEHGTVATAMVILLGLKTGVYGLLRFVFPLLPGAVLQWQGYVVAIAAAGIFYSALLALTQENLRRLLAYAVVSHTGIMVIGLFSLQAQAFQGSILLAVNFGLAVSTLFFALGIIYVRTHSVLLPRLGGLFDTLPWVGITFLVASLAVAGMPGTPGFDAAHLMLEATIHRLGALVTITAALGNVAAVACLLWAFQRAFLAPPDPGRLPAQPHPRATLVETLFVTVMLLVQLVAGFHSEPWMRLVEQPSRALAHPFHGAGGVK